MNVINIRKKLMAPMYSVFQTYKNPFVVTKAFMQYVYDQNGTKHLDLLASNLTISVGHSHSRINERVKSQMDDMVHCSSMYYSQPVAELTEKLLDTFPKRSDGEKWQVQYAVTGTEAVEMAIQLARVASGNLDILSMQNSYHGSMGVAMGASGINQCKHSLPETQHFLHIPAPINENIDKIDELIKSAENMIESSTSNKIAGFIFEQVQGYGGIHILPPEYVQKMAQLVKKYDSYIIADEVQSGLGRMGSHFWSYEMSGIEPDIVVIGKGISNGFPISMVVAKESVFEKYAQHNKFVFFTYGAQPLACVAASETLSIIKETNLQEHAKTLGEYLGSGLYNIKTKHPELNMKIRGQGLMWGIELEPSIAARIYEEMKENHILVGLGGSKKNVLRIMPPMCLQKHDIDNLISVFTKLIEMNFSEGGR